MNRNGMRQLAAVCLLGSGACAPHSPFDRGHLSAALTQRVGIGLRTTQGPDGVIPPGVVLVDGLSEDEAVAIALWNNPGFQADLTSLGVARADLVDSGMIRNPIFTLLLPLGPRQLELTSTIPFEALWQRPRRVAAAKLEVERVAGNLVQSGLDLVREVKVTFADTALVADRLRLAQESSALLERMLAISEARLRAGDISKLEVLTLRLELRRVELDVKRLGREVVTSLETLRAVLGLEDRTQPIALSAEPPAPRLLGDVEAAVKEALALRPDLRSAELMIEASGARTDWESSRMFTPSSAVVKATGGGSQGFEIAPGVTLEVPLFNQNRGGVLRGQSEIERAQWRYLVTRQKISVEVRQAFGRYQQATEGLQAIQQSLLPGVDESIRLAEKAFGAGETSFLFTLETLRRGLEARSREAETMAELRKAAAELDRGIGRKRLDG